MHLKKTGLASCNIVLKTASKLLCIVLYFYRNCFHLLNQLALVWIDLTCSGLSFSVACLDITWLNYTQSNFFHSVTSTFRKIKTESMLSMEGCSLTRTLPRAKWHWPPSIWMNAMAVSANSEHRGLYIGNESDSQKNKRPERQLKCRREVIRLTGAARVPKQRAYSLVQAFIHEALNNKYWIQDIKLTRYSQMIWPMHAPVTPSVKLNHLTVCTSSHSDPPGCKYAYSSSSSCLITPVGAA